MSLILRLSEKRWCVQDASTTLRVVEDYLQLKRVPVHTGFRRMEGIFSAAWQGSKYEQQSVDEDTQNLGSFLDVLEGCIACLWEINAGERNVASCSENKTILK